MDTTTTHNPQLELAHNFLMNTGKSLFLTGKAGTGKTTFLKQLRQKTFKRIVVVAPTGVAAINAGGVTIHSFFQFPFGPQIPNQYLPESQRRAESAFHFGKEKLNIIRSMDLLVIDEISMVRADLLDAIDGVLRKFRNKSQPFGGIQVLMIGDLQQLAPVVKENEWEVLKPIYSGPFFFQSKTMENHPIDTIELKHIYRQSDDRFINVLNEIRENKISQQTINILNSRHIPNFNQAEGYITLCSHNRQAQYINEQKLQAIPLTPTVFKAAIEGDFPEYSYPNDQQLMLKPGAQVMFVKNDTSREKLYYNGKIGHIQRISDGTVYVKCDNDEAPIAVGQVEWQNFKYSLNENTNEIEETIIGKFSQIPLKTAWAITIHKSQGLTFEKAIIDANAAFAHGQVYVALSRCKTLEGLILSSPIEPRSIITSQDVNSFILQSESNRPNPTLLKTYQIEYEWELTTELFNFTALWRRLLYFEKELNQHQSVVFGSLPTVLNVILSQFKPLLIDVAQKFELQLRQLFSMGKAVADNPLLNERITKGCHYFNEKFTALMQPLVSNTDVETDNAVLRKAINDQMQRIESAYTSHINCLTACSQSFTIAAYLHARSISSIEKSKTTTKTKAQSSFSNSKHPALYNQLRTWRNTTADEKNLPEYMVLQTKTMVDLADSLPDSLRELAKIKGMGKKKVDLWGKELLTIIANYCADKGIATKAMDFTQEIPEPKKEKRSSEAITIGLFKMGFSMKEIAQKNNRALSTIEEHLTKAIAKGEIEVEKLVLPDKINTIKMWFIENGTQSLSAAKQALGEAFSYSEIKMVLADLKHHD